LFDFFFFFFFGASSSQRATNQPKLQRTKEKQKNKEDIRKKLVKTHSFWVGKLAAPASSQLSLAADK
jgi:hypothetical protein